MKLGIIGFGNRITHMVKEILKQRPGAEVVGIVDPRDIPDEQIAFLGKRPEVCASAEELITRLRPDGILIGTRCSLHAGYAAEVLPSGIPLFLEKPVATTFEDWRMLKEAADRHPTPVVVSHPLRLTTMVQLVKEIADSGVIGTIEHVQAVNNVPYGGVYYHSWYRDENETGGLFLQKATHDFDYINFVLGQRATGVMAMTSKQIFKGDKPAGLKCIDCEENRTCADSTVGKPEEHIWPHCSFAVDTGNEDSGSALLRYESGMHVSYSQNFFARREAGRRGATFLGYKGTIEFDFMTGIVRVVHHHRGRVDTYRFEKGEGHFGGDAKLAENYIDIIENGSPSLSSLSEGLTSALMCLAARRSAETNSYQPIALP